MKEHLRKHEITYLIIFITFCLILATIFIYLGTEAKKKNHYTKEEAIGIMKLKADQLTRLIEISSSENTCKESEATTLTSKEMETYGFDKKFYKKVVYTLKCENEKQIVSISITGKGSLSGYEIKNYISNQKKENSR